MSSAPPHPVQYPSSDHPQEPEERVENDEGFRTTSRSSSLSSIAHLLQQYSNTSPVSLALQGQDELDQYVERLNSATLEEDKFFILNSLSQKFVMTSDMVMSRINGSTLVEILLDMLELGYSETLLTYVFSCLCTLLRSEPFISNIIIESIDSLVNRIQSLSLSEPAENAVKILDLLSDKHSKRLISSNAIPVCLGRFYSVSNSFRNSTMSMIAKCMANVRTREFRRLHKSVSWICKKLSPASMYADNMCLCLVRMVNNFHNNPTILLQIADNVFLTNVLKVVSVRPMTLGREMLRKTVRMMAILCCMCPSTAIYWLKNGIVATLTNLLSGYRVPRSPDIQHMTWNEDELYELVHLIGELLPRLPLTEPFTVNTLLQQPAPLRGPFVWWWSDCYFVWHEFSPAENVQIEAAYQKKVSKLKLTGPDGSKKLDFRNMRMYVKGQCQFVERKIEVCTASEEAKGPEDDSRLADAQQNWRPTKLLIDRMFNVVHQICISSVGVEIRLRCLDTLLRMIHYGRPKALAHCLKPELMASNIATMLASPEQKGVVKALQMAELVMDKLPDTLTVFCRHGIKHALEKIVSSDAAFSSPHTPSTVSSLFSNPGLEQLSLTSQTAGTSASHHMEASSSGDPPRLGDVLKRKRNPHLSPDEDDQDRERQSRERGKRQATDSDPTAAASSRQSSASGDRSSVTVSSWIREHAAKLLEEYHRSGRQSPVEILNRVRMVCTQLAVEEDQVVECLKKVSQLLQETDVSTFELIQGGLINTLLNFLTSPTSVHSLEHRLRCFLHVFANCPTPGQTYVTHQPSCSDQHPSSLLRLLHKLMACLHLQEQFQMQMTDGADASSSDDSDEDDVRYSVFLRCQFQRHPSCSGLHEGRELTMKVDPHTLVVTVEKYLVQHGCARRRDGEERPRHGNNSDDDEEDLGASEAVIKESFSHLLELVFCEHVLPYNISLLNAFLQVIHPGENVHSVRLNDMESILARTYTVFYRSAPEQVQQADSRSWALSRQALPSTADHSWTGQNVSLLTSQLRSRLPAYVTVPDASLDTIALLTALHAISTLWTCLYHVPFSAEPLVPWSSFVSSQLSKKAMLQLCDNEVVEEGRSPPSWLTQISHVAPFLLSFEVRRLLLYVTALDRKRALYQVWAHTTVIRDPDDAPLHPPLPADKREVKRETLLENAEKVIEQFQTSLNASKQLEIGFKDEEGQGQGPTLEFYTLVSHELQRADLHMWRGETVQASNPLPFPDADSQVHYMHGVNGLFPAPLDPSTSPPDLVSKVKAKFRFLGQFMARALMDFRMIDITLNPVLYKWLLGLKYTLTSCDLYTVDPTMARSFRQLEDMYHWMQRRAGSQRVSEVGVPAERVEDWEVFFTLPGTDIPLMEGGQHLQVTSNNLHTYLQRMVHWSVEKGVMVQMEALCDGFKSVLPLPSLRCFYPHELDQLLCGCGYERWDVNMLQEACKPTHGYNNNSPTITMLYQVMSSFNLQQQQQFLSFVTGAARLAVGGLYSLKPPLTISLKLAVNPDSMLPSVMTCFNYLKLPEYSSVHVLRERLDTASREGTGSFPMS